MDIETSAIYRDDLDAGGPMTDPSDSPGATLARGNAMAKRLRQRVDFGVMSFPLAPFPADGSSINADVFRTHVRRQIDAGAAAIFPCCGTSEFFSLSEDEYAELVGVAVMASAGQVPVISGAGYGWPNAVRFAERAEAAGADGLLVLPQAREAATGRRRPGRPGRPRNAVATRPCLGGGRTVIPIARPSGHFPERCSR